MKELDTKALAQAAGGYNSTACFNDVSTGVVLGMVFGFAGGAYFGGPWGAGIGMVGGGAAGGLYEYEYSPNCQSDG